MGDSAETARLLWRDWLPEKVKDYVSSAMQLSQADAETVVAAIAGVHDIGKATPAFQCKVQMRAEHVRECGLKVPQRVDGNCPHASLGQLIVQDWANRNSIEGNVAVAYASIVGGHHGTTPSFGDLDEIASRNRRNQGGLIGAAVWRLVQDELIDYVFENCGLSNLLAGRHKPKTIPQSVQVLLTGLVIVADWIASNATFFPLTCETEVNWSDCRDRAICAWKKLDLPRPLRLKHVTDDDTALFKTRFPELPADAVLRPTQKAAVQAARQLDECGLLIVESPMGSGKTEASLICAEIMASKYGAGGMAYLLPTMATSNAMFTRVHSWLNALYEAVGLDVQSLRLMHSKSELNEGYSRLKTWHPSWMGDDSATGEGVVAHQWFSERKRGLLASFVVGTVDQLLMAALNAKHVHLRHLGLAGKVVVVDEVHAYDSYMNAYLDRALQFLGEYEVPVVLLSATLPSGRREELIKAYRGQNRRTSLAYPTLSESGRPAYPLITLASRNKSMDPQYYRSEFDGIGTNVAIEYLPDDDVLLAKTLEEALIDGGCVCVIRDTVARAQHTYDVLAEWLNTPIKLVHSRFMSVDRLNNDAELLRLLGPDTDERPESLVVVGTQVVEQSLDIDFDLMITDMAPMDLLLQRIGRLHRHKRGEGQSNRPPRLRSARCIITGSADWAGELPEWDKGITYVYHPAVLWQTAWTLKQYANSAKIRVPEDVSILVEHTYEGLREGSDNELCKRDNRFAEAIRGWREMVRGKESRAKDWLLPKLNRSTVCNGWMHVPVDLDGDARGRMAVRDVQDSLEVILVQQTDRGLRLLPRIADLYCIPGYFGDEDEVPDDQVARIAALCTVSLPPLLTRPWCIERVIDVLEKHTPEGWQHSFWLKGCLSLAMDSKNEALLDCGDTVYRLCYSDAKGLELIS